MTRLTVSSSLPTCALFKAYTGERVWKAMGNRLRGTYYMSGDKHDSKIGQENKEQTLVNTLL